MENPKGDIEAEATGVEPESDNRPGRIVWHPEILASHHAATNALPALTRTSTRDSASSARTNAASISDAHIIYRTLTYQVSDSQLVRRSEEDLTKFGKASQDDDTQYFERLNFHMLPVEEICQLFNVFHNQGLSTAAAARRLQRDGKNTVAKRNENYLLKLLRYVFGGFCSILWIGVIVFFLCWKPLSSPPAISNMGLAILVIIVIFLQASFSAFQDWSTKRVMNSILDMLPAEALVLRDGVQARISATDLVVGDIVHISIGNKVPADMRLIQTSGDVRFDRSMLTGESDEIEGAIDSTDENFLETRNIAAMGTSVINGNATGIVVLTGSNSIMGRISKMTAGVKEKPTLIQREISRFIRIIICLTILLSSMLLFTWVGWLRVDHSSYMNVVAMLNNVMGCVVAFIPEGMPVGVALTLMMIAKRMKVNNVLPKGLSTVETLGCVNIICSDKTGTLTENKMVVTTVGFVDKQCTADDAVNEATAAEPLHAIEELHKAAFLCNDGTFDPTTTHLPIKERLINGNATDAAVLRFAESLKPGQDVEKASPRVYQIAFNSKTKWMLTLHEESESPASEMAKPKYLAYVKGAPDVLLPKCSKYWSTKTNSIQDLDENARDELSALQSQLSRNAERVILLCQRHCQPREALGSNYFGDEIVELVQDLTVIGVLGITDPPRPETAETVAACRRAGTRFFMVTGDFGLTAAAIGRQVGIFTGTAEPDTVQDLVTLADESASSSSSEKPSDLPRSHKSLLLEGPSISLLNTAQWDAVATYEEIVFARTTPEQKLRIVNELKSRNCTLAVTGDGVNDAPALRAADVGIAVVSGSDVAIEASDLVLLDKFSSITEAIRLGRLVFQNLQKLISYLLPAGSWSEIWPVLLSTFFGVPLPLSSFLMIIICIFTDLLLSLSLVLEKEEFDLLSIPPRNPKKDHLINAKIYTQSYLFIGVLETIAAHCMYFFYFSSHAGIPPRAMFFAFEQYSAGFYSYTADELMHFNQVGQCVYFVTLVICQWGNVLSVRNKRLSILQADPFFRKGRKNPFLLLGMLASLIIAIFVTEVPGIQQLFGTAHVPIEFWFIPLPLAVGILACDEVRKLLVRSYPKGPLARIAW